MPLPINIHDLLTGRTVEWERIEFKKGWNPEDVIHSICAFANDFNNWGGGYLVIGIDEADHRPVFPPKGLTQKELHNIQKELLELCHKIHPNYFPIVEPVEISNKTVLIIWVPGGQYRPYQAPQSLAKASPYAYYIRRFNNTVRLKRDEEFELLSLAATVPFDDRIHHQSSITDLKLPLIQDFLKDAGSDLYNISGTMPFEQLCRQMAIIDGPPEYIRPRNVGLLLFNDHPEKIFPKAQIEIVIFPEGTGGDKITEKIFEGPIHYQISNALTFIQNVVIKEHIQKMSDRPEAVRFFNYPYVAIKEALVNAMYHRSYEIREPVEVRVNTDSIQILSFPGPDRSIKDEDLKTGKFVARRYRNRRLGEFFKELDLTEGRCTGIPKMIRVMEINGSPCPVYTTDEERTYFITTLPVHTWFLKEIKEIIEAHDEAYDEAHDEISNLSGTELKILVLSEEKLLSKRDILEKLGHKNLSGNVKKSLQKLIKTGLIKYTVPEKLRSKNQRYQITEKGLRTIESSKKELKSK